MPSPLRVAMTLTQNWHAVPGGTATAANALARTLDRDDRVELLGVVPAGQPPGEPWTPSVRTVALRLRVPYLYDAWTFLQRPRVSSVTGAVDLIHLTIPIACPRESLPLVASVHDLLPLTMPEMFSRRGTRLMTKGLERIAERADMVIVPSRMGEAEFVRHGFDPSRLAVVPLGVSVTAEPAPEAVEATMARHRLDAPYVLFVGTPEPRKGLDVLLKAFEALDRSGVVLALVGPDGWGDVLGADFEALGNRVRRLGFVSDHDLRLLRSGAAVCCLPSRAEGFGLPVLEAMAAGSAVITTADTPMAEFAHDVARLVPIGDHKALAHALAEVLDDAPLAAAMGAAGRARASDYSWQRTTDSVLDVYRRVVDQ